MRRCLPIAALVGCSFTPPAPVAYVRLGPARDALVTPLAALPVACARGTMGCREGYKRAIANTTRMAIELDGWSVVDGERINAELGRRETRTEATAFGERTIEDVTQQSWLDLPEQQQRDLLTAMGIRGVLHTTLALGIPHGLAGQRTVTVAVGITRLSDEAIVWQSQCSVETGDYHSEPQAIELATRCALEAGALW